MPTGLRPWSTSSGMAAIEKLPLLAFADDHHALQSTVAPAEPHEFDAELVLTAGERREVLPFRMEEPEGHHH